MNNCMFVGRLGKEAELAQAGNSQVCRFSVATDSGYGDKKVTMWVSCNLWGKRGQSLAQYLVKGTKVMVIGELSETEYNGKKYLNLNVNQIEMLGERQQEGSQQQQYGTQQPQAQYNPQAQPAVQAQPAQQGAFDPFNSVNSDIPF